MRKRRTYYFHYFTRQYFLISFLFAVYLLYAFFYNLTRAYSYIFCLFDFLAWANINSPFFSQFSLFLIIFIFIQLCVNHNFFQHSLKKIYYKVFKCVKHITCDDVWLHHETHTILKVNQNSFWKTQAKLECN